MSKKPGRIVSASVMIGQPGPKHPKMTSQRFAKQAKAKVKARLAALASFGMGNEQSDDGEAVEWIVARYTGPDGPGLETLAKDAIDADPHLITTDEYSTKKRLARKARSRIRDTSKA